ILAIGWTWLRIARVSQAKLFFFQAEDGIRDFHVTGVQTCALPISMARIDQPDFVYKNETAKFNAVVEDIVERHAKGQPVLVGTRSEERRVGEEWRCGGWAERETKQATQERRQKPH